MKQPGRMAGSYQYRPLPMTPYQRIWQMRTMRMLKPMSRCALRRMSWRSFCRGRVRRRHATILFR